MSRRYVILTAHGSFIPQHARADDADAGLLRQNRAWAEQLDASDGRLTPDDGPTRADRSQEVLLVRIHPAPAGEEMLASTLEGYREAARWAGPRNAIGILVGHGDAATVSATAWVDLAPSRHLRVTLEMLLQIRSRPAADLTGEQNTVVRIGEALRRERIGRVDLLTCSTGYGGLGQRLLDELHAVWRVRVRGLRGNLASTTDQRGVGMWVEAPTFGCATPPRPDPSHVYYDRIPDDSEWTSSRGR